MLATVKVSTVRLTDEVGIVSSGVSVAPIGNTAINIKKETKFVITRRYKTKAQSRSE